MVIVGLSQLDHLSLAGQERPHNARAGGSRESTLCKLDLIDERQALDVFAMSGPTTQLMLEFVCVEAA